jgi:hypothetical protein
LQALRLEPELAFRSAVWEANQRGANGNALQSLLRLSNVFE